MTRYPLRGFSRGFSEHGTSPTDLNLAGPKKSARLLGLNLIYLCFYFFALLPAVYLSAAWDR